jgi:hypothetical protein
MLLSEAPVGRRCFAALVGGAVGGLTWAYLKDFGGVDLISAVAIGACAHFVAEFASSIVRPGWPRGMLWGIAGGLIVGIGGVLLFPIEDATHHIVRTAVSFMFGGLAMAIVHERFVRKDGGT